MNLIDVLHFAKSIFIVEVYVLKQKHDVRFLCPTSCFSYLL